MKEKINIYEYLLTTKNLIQTQAQSKQNKYLKEKIGNKYQKQWETMANINTLCNWRHNAIKFLDRYSSIIFESKNGATGMSKFKYYAWTNASKITSCIFTG